MCFVHSGGAGGGGLVQRAALGAAAAAFSGVAAGGGMRGKGRWEAYTLSSVAGDLKISETVDLPNWLVSMTLPRGIFA
jgi:hypothetical protein